MAWGFEQQHYINFDETFASFIKWGLIKSMI